MLILIIIQAGSELVLKTSTYPNKRNVAYATIRSTNPATKAGGIELGAQFSLVRIYEPIMDSDELVQEVCDCKTIGDAFSSGFLIAQPAAFVRYFLPINILEYYFSTFNHTTMMSNFLLQMRKND